MSAATRRAAAQARGLLVAELFGPTFQGEGPSAGRVAVFVRLSRCNLACTWCDTPYTWDWSRYDPRAETPRMSAEAVTAWLLDRPAPQVVVTGGEPLLQQDALVPMLRGLAGAGRLVEVETNGTLPPSPALVEVVAAFNVSPKLSSAGGARGSRIDAAALCGFAASGNAAFKFVVTGPGDLEEIAALQQAFGLDPVWVMPEATTADALLAGIREVAEEALARGWNISSRLHVLLWGDRRGR